MTRSRFAHLLLLGAMLAVRNAVQLAFLLDGRRRANQCNRRVAD